MRGYERANDDLHVSNLAIGLVAETKRRREWTTRRRSPPPKLDLEGIGQAGLDRLANCYEQNLKVTNGIKPRKCQWQ